MEKTLTRNRAVEEAPLQNDLMLFDPANSQFYVLNATMAFLWKHCDGTVSLSEIVERAVCDFADADPEQVRGDFGVAAEELQKLGLLI